MPVVSVGLNPVRISTLGSEGVHGQNVGNTNLYLSTTPDVSGLSSADMALGNGETFNWPPNAELYVTTGDPTITGTIIYVSNGAQKQSSTFTGTVTGAVSVTNTVPVVGTVGVSGGSVGVSGTVSVSSLSASLYFNTPNIPANSDSTFISFTAAQLAPYQALVLDMIGPGGTASNIVNLVGTVQNGTFDVVGVSSTGHAKLTVPIQSNGIGIYAKNNTASPFAMTIGVYGIPIPLSRSYWHSYPQTGQITGMTGTINTSFGTLATLGTNVEWLAANLTSTSGGGFVYLPHRAGLATLAGNIGPAGTVYQLVFAQQGSAFYTNNLSAGATVAAQNIILPEWPIAFNPVTSAGNGMNLNLVYQ